MTITPPLFRFIASYKDRVLLHAMIVTTWPRVPQFGSVSYRLLFDLFTEQNTVCRPPTTLP
jgi:hypothetical protein